MNRSITKAQRAELEEACTFGAEEAHDLLRKYTGIEARPYTATCTTTRTRTLSVPVTMMDWTICWKKQMWRCWMDKLKPCPFCGGAGLEAGTEETGGGMKFCFERMYEIP